MNPLSALDGAKKIGDISGFVDVPPNQELSETLHSQYMGLQRHKLKIDTSAHLKFLFDIIEGNASWVVLRQIAGCFQPGCEPDPKTKEYSPDKCISNYYSREQRLKAFVDELYKNPQDYYFFGEREKAIENLGSLGVINTEDYRA
jgi:hypothetical protein